MKTLSIDEIVSMVRTKYDEISTNESEMIGNTDDSNFETVVRSCIPDAYRFVVNSADLSMLEGKSLQTNPTIDDNLIAHIELPDDFLRCVTVRLSSWHSSANEIITEDTPEYRMQADPYACGTYQYPVAALVHTSNGRKIELYKAKTKQDTILSFVYMPMWKNGETDVEIPDLLAESFIYYVAALTATTFREDVANDFFKVAKSIIGIE